MEKEITIIYHLDQQDMHQENILEVMYTSNIKFKYIETIKGN